MYDSGLKRKQLRSPDKFENSSSVPVWPIVHTKTLFSITENGDHRKRFPERRTLKKWLGGLVWTTENEFEAF